MELCWAVANGKLPADKVRLPAARWGGRPSLLVDATARLPLRSQFLAGVQCAGIPLAEIGERDHEDTAPSNASMEVDAEDGARDASRVPLVDMLWMVWCEVDFAETSGQLTKVQHAAAVATPVLAAAPLPCKPLRRCRARRRRSRRTRSVWRTWRRSC